MKNSIFFGLSLFTALSTFSQTNQNKTSASNTWTKLSSSSTIYAVNVSFTKPLQWNDELNAVTFLHRKSPSYVISPQPVAAAASGAIVAMVSTNCGVSWDSTAIFSNNFIWGRYPGGAIYNPPANTDINNAYIVGAGPAVESVSSGWGANWYASKKLGAGNYNNAPSTVTNAQQVKLSAGPYSVDLGKHDFSAYSFTATDDGKMRVIAGVIDDQLFTDTAITLVTGTFNNGVFDWAGTVFNPPTTANSFGNENWTSKPIMAWNEQGTVGYIVVMGQRTNSIKSNLGYQPIVYKTINSGLSWTLESGINFNSAAYTNLKKRLWPTVSGTDTIPNFLWTEGYDCSVDGNNKLHIFTPINAHLSSHPDSLWSMKSFTAEKYLWPHLPGKRPYLYDFIYDGTAASPAWSHLLIDSMSTEGPSGSSAGPGYLDNPWDANPQKVRIDARIQMSRTPDGKQLVYTWAETDTTFTFMNNKWNVSPNIKARLLDVTSGLLSPVEINATYGTSNDISDRAWFHVVSPKCKLISNSVAGTVVQLPMTVTNSNPYAQLGTNTHWYSCATLDFTVNVNTVGILQTNSENLNQSSIFPNPAKNDVTLKMSLATNSNVDVEIFNVTGQVVKTAHTQGQAGTNTIQLDVRNLSSGIYFVSVKINNAVNTKKLIIE